MRGALPHRARPMWGAAAIAGAVWIAVFLYAVFHARANAMYGRAVPLDPKTGEFESLNDVKWNAPKQLLGVEAGIGTFHPHYRAEPTAAGRRWGLNRWWLSLWAADPATVTSALAMDENGLAAAWVPQLRRASRDRVRAALRRLGR